MEEVAEALQHLSDAKHQAFTAKLIPTVDPSTILGVKIPALRTLAKRLLKAGTAYEFLCELPHTYVEENQLHALIVNEYSKDVEETVTLVEQFAPYVDNWAVSDAFSPKSFARNLDAAHPYLKRWLQSDNLWLKRIAMQILLSSYMGEAFDADTMHAVAACALSDAPKFTDEYYLNMAVAWYLSMALLKHPKDTLPLFDPPCMPRFVHNMSLKKARESRRIDADYKAYLQSLKM